MPTTRETTPMLQQISSVLTRREAELQAVLRAAAEAREKAADVQDFKDVAAEESQSVVDEVTLAHAAGELAQVHAAMRRIDEGSYGLCLDCGDPIDERRLLALPATPYCTACQAAHERPPGPR